MKNRERLLKTSIYDTLVRMNVNLMPNEGYPYDKCIMDALISEHQKIAERCINAKGNCHQCIQTWLNEEE